MQILELPFEEPKVDVNFDDPSIGSLLKDYNGHEFHFTAKKTCDGLEVKTTCPH